MRRESYLNDDLLKEISGRLRFGASSLEDQLDRIPEPKPKPWTYPSHPMDGVAAEFGLRGFEFKVLQDAAMRRLRYDKTLQTLYGKFLLAAKLTLDDELEAARQHERHLSEEKNKRESSYRHQLNQWEHKKSQVIKSWTNLRETIRTRWGRMGRSIAAMLERDASFGSISLRDQFFLGLLADRGIVEIDDNPDADARRVLRVDWDAYSAMSIEDINEVILALNEAPVGGFIAKPTVTKLDEETI